MEPTEYLGRKELFEALLARGITRYEVEKLIEGKVITSRPFRPHGAAYFHWPTVRDTLKLTRNGSNK